MFRRVDALGLVPIPDDGASVSSSGEGEQSVESGSTGSTGYRLLSGYTLKQGESPREERFRVPAGSQGVVGNTLKHGVASKCRRGALNP